MMEDQYEVETLRHGNTKSDKMYSHQSEMTKKQGVEQRDLNQEYVDEMSEVTLSSNESGSESEKDQQSEAPKKWTTLWKKTSPMTAAKMIKKTVKQKLKREARDSPESSLSNETSKGTGSSAKSEEEEEVVVVEEEEIVVVEEEDDSVWSLEDKIPLNNPVETIEDPSGMLADLSERFSRRENVDGYKLCLLELQERSQIGPSLNPQEVYEFELLQRHANGEELHEESNDLEHFVKRRLMYRRLQIDLESLRNQQKNGKAIDENLKFVLELFERRRLQIPMDIMEKLALDLLERGRLGEKLNDGEMNELLDIMDMLKSRHVFTPCGSEELDVLLGKVDPKPKAKSLQEEQPKDLPIQREAAKGWEVPWTSIGTQQGPTEDTKAEAETVSLRGWLSYWRSDDQLVAVKARDKIQKELLDKSLLKAKLSLEMDNLKMELKKASARVLQLGGTIDEAPGVVSTEGGVPGDEMDSKPQNPEASTESRDLETTLQEKDEQIAALEGQIRAFRAEQVATASETGRQEPGPSATEKEADELEAECRKLRKQLKELNKMYKESVSSQESYCLKMGGVEAELKQTKHDLEQAREELDRHRGNFVSTSDRYVKLEEKYNSALSKISEMEEEIPTETRLRATEVLQEMGTTGGIEVLIERYKSAEATIGSLRSELASAKQEAEAVNLRQAEYCDAVAMCKKLEVEAEYLRMKLQRCEANLAYVRQEAKNSITEVTEAQTKIAEQSETMEALSEQVQFLQEENGRLIEENIELKEMCEEMIESMGTTALHC
eukprot:scaffold543_cov119-Cylindrotheca_fusiformis.AAC.33